MELDSQAVLAVCIGRMRKAILQKYINKFGIASLSCDLFNDTEIVETLLQGVNPVARNTVERDLQKWSESGIQWCTLGSCDFPAQLLTLAVPPLVLFYRGASPSGVVLDQSVSVVGSRAASSFSCDLAAQLGYEVVSHGGGLVSGLALGIDGAAHRGALKGVRDHGDAGGKTIAVLGNGLSSIYPSAHRGLAHGILDAGGTLLSQFEPSCPPLPHQFLMRNQLIAGYSTTTVVVAAARRSGALNTARCALELGREVVAVPGAFYDIGMVGCNVLIQDGAHLLLKAAEIVQFFAANTIVGATSITSKCGEPTNRLQDNILNFIASEGMISQSRIVDSFGNEACAAITELELAGVLRALPGGILALK